MVNGVQEAMSRRVALITCLVAPERCKFSSSAILAVALDPQSAAAPITTA
jgi:hypothetical protein